MYITPICNKLTRIIYLIFIFYLYLCAAKTNKCEMNVNKNNHKHSSRIMNSKTYNIIELHKRDGSFCVQQTIRIIMKTRFTSIIERAAMTLLLMVFTTGSAWADDSGNCGTTDHESDVQWSYDSSSKTLTISGNGAMADYDSSSQPWHNYRDDITSVVIESGVTSIGEQAFSGCKLTSITLPEGLETIGAQAFYNNGTTIENVNIPESVTTIGANAFNGTTVNNYYINNIPSKIALSATTPFQIANETQIHVFTMMKSIFENAQYWSNYKGHYVADIDIVHVESITLDNASMIMKPNTSGKLNATINPNNARVKDVVFTSSNPFVVDIVDASAGTFRAGDINGDAIITCTANDGSGVFATCNITVNNSFTPATSVTLNKTNETMEVGHQFTLNATVSPSYATYKNVTWVSSDENVATVAAVSGNNNRATVTAVGIGYATITAISEDGAARATCNVTVTLNGNCGAEVTWSLTGDGVLTISGTGAMKNYNNNQPWKDYMSDITTAVIEEGVTSISNRFLYGCTALTSVTIGSSVTTIGASAFNGCTALTSVTIGSSVTTIGASAFYGCTSLATISGAAGVTTIESSAFDDTAWLTKLPDGLTYVGHVAYRFKGTDTSVNLNAGTTQIYDHCFWGTGIRVVVIPASVTSIGSGTFEESGLERAYFLGTTPPTLESNVFNRIATLVVPANAYKEYSAFPVDNWECGYTITCGAGVTATTYAPIVAEGETVTLSYTGEVPAGCDVRFSLDGGTTLLDGNTFEMPANDVTVTATYTTIPWSGTGTDTDPFIIEYPSQLDLLAQRVNSGTGDDYAASGYSGKYFQLGADIAYDPDVLTIDNDEDGTDDSNFTAIGDDNGNKPFKGHFDGNNHTISGIRINKVAFCQGLFGCIKGEGDNKAEVKNVILDDAIIKALVGCGGIVGFNDGGIVNGCTSAAKIIRETSSGAEYGGIVGTNKGTVSNCLYIGNTVEGTSSVGAIVGYNGGTVSNCYFTNTAITGKDNDGNALDNANCAVGYNDTSFSTGTVTNVGLAYILSLGEGITLDATPTAYGPLTAYDDFALSYNNGTATTLYSTKGNQVALSYTGTVPDGYVFGGITATAGTLSGNDTDGYTLTMPGSDVIVTATLIPTSGTCGDYGNEDNVTWKVTDEDQNGTYETITISGNGAMADYYSNPVPWAAFKDVLTTAVIGDGVTSIGYKDFYQFTALTSVSIASSVTSIGAATFFECTNLTTISGASGVTYVGSSAFDRTAWINALPNGLTYVGHVAYKFKGDGTSVNLDAATTQIYKVCFQGSKITSIIIPASVESIEGFAFANSANLQKVYVLRHESNYLLYSSKAFDYCSNLTAIIVPADAYDDYKNSWSSYESKLKNGYTVTCGTAGISATSYAPIVAQGEEVTLNAPTGYVITSASYNDGSEDHDITPVNDVYSFIMPASNVTVSAIYTTIPWSGTGTDTDPFIIEYPSQLDLLAQRVNSGTGDDYAASGYRDKYFKLGADITYAHTSKWDDKSNQEKNFTAIGTSDKSFCGFFDGQNHVISGIRIYNTSNRQGLFGYIYDDENFPKVENIILADTRITGYNYVGAIVGYNEFGNIENCHVLSNVLVHSKENTSENHGGIVGYNQNGSMVTRCTSAASITPKSSDDENYGGIVGLNRYGTVSDCLYLGSTVEGKNSGAIVGKNIYIYDKSLGYSFGTVRNCYSTNKSTMVGTTNNQDEAIENCYRAPQDAQDNSGFLALMAARNAALTAVERTTPLSTTVDITLKERTLYKDGDWNTLCLPFDVTIANSPLAGDNVVAMTLNTQSSGLSGTTLTLNFDNAPETIPAGTPFIIKWATKENPAANLVSPKFTGVTINNSASTEVSFTGGKFKGTYDPIVWSEENKSILLLGTNNTLFWPQPEGENMPHLNAFRAYFELSDGAGVREIKLNFDGENESTGITTTDCTDYTDKAGAWYDMQGRKVSKPTKKGMYIHNGNKVVVK